MPEKLSSEQRKVIGGIIRDARVGQGISQTDIGRTAQEKGWLLAQSTISAIESGRRSPSNVQALIFMAILGCRCMNVMRFGINPRFLETLGMDPDWEDPAVRAFTDEFAVRFPETVDGFMPSMDGWFREVCCSALERLRRERPELFEEDWRHRPRGPRWPAPTEPV